MPQRFDVEMFRLTEIPEIMLAQNPPWTVAAALQKRWFGGAPQIYPAVGEPDTTTVTMKWLLGHDRMKSFYDENIITPRIWQTPNSEAILVKRLRDQGAIPATGRTVTFGNICAPTNILEKSYFQSLAYKTNKLKDPLDDVFGALGSFNFRFLASGRLEKLNNTNCVVTVESVRVYIQDKYDFDGFQWLGCWSKLLNSVQKLPSPLHTSLTNYDYALWRKIHGKGGDFLVYSDTMLIPEATPWSFRANLPGSFLDTPIWSPLAPASTPLQSPWMTTPPPGARRIVTEPGDTLSGLAATYYSDWRYWPLIWDQNRAVIGPLPSTLATGLTLELASLHGFSEAVLDGAKRRAPKWKNNEIR
ncbi:MULTISPECIES: DUF6402 family protein [Roseomonadaceae]|uniref:LysM domain-containing protein n=1 Tax=Falsiroseomonas oleicola TaxID=2801474 RepID=A0ABS6HF66_9PROT|nr:DUF6402 family protein [Roseomonas oleicola]MBU8546338.1 hypothetical protein [Roseomonas oleicola]